jgi:hypothetical protein
MDYSPGDLRAYSNVLVSKDACTEPSGYGRLPRSPQALNHTSAICYCHQDGNKTNGFTVIGSTKLPHITPANNLENCQDVWGTIAKNLSGTTESRVINQREDSAKRD